MKSSARGFALIELLIVIAIIGILAVASIPTFSDFLNSQRLSQSAKQVKSDLRSAQNRALNGIKNASGDKVWGIRFNGSNSYNIVTCGDLDFDNAPYCIGETLYKTKTLASGFTISNGLFVFDEVSGEVCDSSGAIAPGIPSSVDIELGGSTRTITVTAGGKIEER